MVIKPLIVSYLFVFLIIGLCILVFYNAFPEEFVFDAPVIIGQNILEQNNVSWFSLIFKNYWGNFNFAGLWRPLPLITYYLEGNILGFGYNAAYYVYTNLILHIIVSILVWQIVLSTTSSQRIAMSTTILFSVHPVVTEIVPNVVGRADLLSAIFTLSSLLLWERYNKDKSMSMLIILGICWFCGLCSKENAVVLFPLVVLSDIVFIKTREEVNIWCFFKKKTGGYIFLLAVGLLWLCIRTAILSPYGNKFTSAVNNPLVLELPGPRIMTAISLVGEYLLQSVCPVNLCADYSFKTIPTANSPFHPGFLVTTIAFIFFLSFAKKYEHWPDFVFGGLFFLVTLGPMMNILFLIGTIRADRFLYIPMIGVLIILTSTIHHFYTWFELKFITISRYFSRYILIIFIMLIFMIVTIDRNTDWKNNFVLWRQTIEVAPTNVKARHNLARQILAKQSVISDKDRNEVIQHLEKSIILARELPGDEFFEPYVNLGQVYIQEGILAMKSGKNTDDSRRFFNKAVDCLLEGIHRSQFRGRRYESWKETISRKQDLLNNITIEFGDAKLYLNLATVLDALGRTPEVIKQLHNAIKTEPFNPEGYIRLALVYAREGDHVQAKAVLNMVERLNISNKEQLFLLAKIYTNLGNYEKARLLLEKVNQTKLQTKK